MQPKDSRAPRGTRAQFEVLLRNTSHNIYAHAGGRSLPASCYYIGAQGPYIIIYIGPLGPKARWVRIPCTVMGSAIIQPGPPYRGPGLHVAPATRWGHPEAPLVASAHKSNGPSGLSLCSARGSRAFGPSPLHPPFTLIVTLVTSNVIGGNRGAWGSSPSN